MIMITLKETQSDPAASILLPENGSKQPSFPSPPLIVINVLSCFLATAAFASALTLVFDSDWPEFAIPSGVGFGFTISYHSYLYVCVQRHYRSRKETFQSRLPPTLCLALAFVLASAWSIIVWMDTMFWAWPDESYRGYMSSTIPLGAKISTIVAGIELMTVLYIALKCTIEVWGVEREEARHGHIMQPPQSGDTLNFDETTLNPDAVLPTLPFPTPRYMYLISIILATVSLLFALYVGLLLFGIGPFFVANLSGFVLTVPYHAASFVSSGRAPRLSPTLSSRFRRSVPLAFLFVAVWCAVFIVNIFSRHLEEWQTNQFNTIGATVTSGAECLATGYIAIRSVLDRFHT
ncbi:hypothetical protein BDZ94DRAFT_1258591 [Collybia nuda]|uniref:Uncharacterized protein n=1 Tax=Collybia nuda TaxID=64659 RepID=A0A9P5Y7F6_9AGAR|nr:hypothetical protein BDZ94DRAFT_1258591 [Collybia nuda]